MTAAAHDIPQAWPLLLSRDQLCAYLGGLSWDTVAKILPVAPVDLGANVLRYPRPAVDAWAASLPPRLPRALRGEGESSQPAPAADPTAPESRTSAAAERARLRASGGRASARREWKKSPTSSASSAAAAG
ncbi:MAG: hypothetical protein EON91_02535 [Brevundimonas sp.]|uniref:hypothetical protein n=1 Tax=Brevundimonas sp. TaxID=1871086 RepID=UPI001208C551|nr:hypothetical protein [Brevundimonas sp.]RZJ19090.1 MAG: hypothetical protein EON91_02535 [Brevundimonas sp.]